jgi:alanine racemase
VEEGVSLRQAGIDAKILVMADFLPYGRAAMLDHGLTPVLHSLEDIAELNALARERDEQIRFHLKIDSGMGRLGTRARAEQIHAALRENSQVVLEGLMTHFASVSDFTSEQTDIQIRNFRSLCDSLALAGVKPQYVHMSSTGAIAYRRENAWCDLVRPGHAIYGYTSPARGKGPQNALAVKPVLTWKAAVLTVKDIDAGALVGYGGIFQARTPMRIAILAVGYADGLPHRLSNKGRVIACGTQVPILGAVSMDVTTIDATHCPGLRTGDAVTLLGAEGDVRIDAQDIAREAGTISYNVLCGISSRVKRVYI